MGMGFWGLCWAGDLKLLVDEEDAAEGGHAPRLFTILALPQLARQFSQNHEYIAKLNDSLFVLYEEGWRAFACSLEPSAL